MSLIHFLLKKNDGHVIKQGIARIFSEILLTVFYIRPPPPPPPPPPTPRLANHFDAV